MLQPGVKPGDSHVKQDVDLLRSRILRNIDSIIEQLRATALDMNQKQLLCRLDLFNSRIRYFIAMRSFGLLWGFEQPYIQCALKR